MLTVCQISKALLRSFWELRLQTGKCGEIRSERGVCRAGGAAELSERAAMHETHLTMGRGPTQRLECLPLSFQFFLALKFLSEWMDNHLRGFSSLATMVS